MLCVCVCELHMHSHASIGIILTPIFLLSYLPDGQAFVGVRQVIDAADGAYGKTASIFVVVVVVIVMMMMMMMLVVVLPQACCGRCY